MVIDEIINNARVLTQKGMIVKAMDELQNVFPNNFQNSNGDCSTEILNLFNGLTHLSSRFNSLDKEKLTGVIEDGVARIEENKICKSLITLIDDISEKKRLFRVQLKSGDSEDCIQVGTYPDKKNLNTTDLEITINRNYHEFTEKDKLNFLSAISKLLEMDECDIKIKKKYPGSVKLWIELPNDKADLLFEFFERGLLSTIDVIDVIDVSQLNKENAPINFEANERRIINTTRKGANTQRKVSKVNTQQQVLKTRYSDEELQEFEIIVDQKLLESKEQLEFYMNQLAERADNTDTKVKGLDNGIGTAENERLTTMAARMRKHISHLENAKIRISNKVYGICRETGKLISKERLRAVPHATLSIAAKQSKIKR